MVGAPLGRYGLAVVLSGLALLLTLLLEPLVLERSIFLLFVAAVATSALYGGLGPGLVAALLSTLASALFLIPPNYSLLVGLNELLSLGVFLLVATAISWLTQRRTRVEQELEKSEERFRVTFEQAAVGIAHVARDGSWLRVNDRLCDIVGYPREELLRLTFQDITYPQDLERDLNQVKKLLAGEIQTYSIEKRYFRKDGSIVWINLTVSLARKRSGDPDYFISVIEDISKRKRAEEKVRGLNEQLERRVLQRTAQLEEANRELESFSYSVSHDLRAPLRHIGGFSHMLQSTAAPKLDENEQYFLEAILKSTKQAAEMIDDLLSFSRMSRTQMRFGNVEMNRLVKETLNEMAFEADGREADGRDVDWKIAELPEVRGDHSMLKLVWQNLIGNALKYTRPRERAVIEIGATRSNEEGEDVVFFVRDNGVGFDEAYADKLFGVFQRLHRAEEFEGTGIGLATVQRIVHRHGGKVWAEGRVEKGATFNFSLFQAPDKENPD